MRTLSSLRALLFLFVAPLRRGAKYVPCFPSKPFKSHTRIPVRRQAGHSCWAKCVPSNIELISKTLTSAYFVATKKSVRIIWDEPKRLANLDKHGMDFADLNEKFFDTAVVLQAKRDRYRAIGLNIRGVISVIFAVYGKEAVSIISMRLASNAERELYEANRR